MNKIDALVRTSWLRILVFSVAIMGMQSAHALDEISTSFFGNLAVEGYDSVAYFTENRPVQGDPKFEHQWKGATWRFSSGENLAKFVADPEQYAPQYGGYCAYAVAHNSDAGIDPTQFTVHQGKLYLNYNKKIQKKWLANRDGFITDADGNWPSLIAK